MASLKSSLGRKLFVILGSSLGLSIATLSLAADSRDELKDELIGWIPAVVDLQPLTSGSIEDFTEARMIAQEAELFLASETKDFADYTLKKKRLIDHQFLAALHDKVWSEIFEREAKSHGLVVFEESLLKEFEKSRNKTLEPFRKKAFENLAKNFNRDLSDDPLAYPDYRVNAEATQLFGKYLRTATYSYGFTNGEIGQEPGKETGKEMTEVQENARAYVAWCERRKREITEILRKQYTDEALRVLTQSSDTSPGPSPEELRRLYHKLELRFEETADARSKLRTENDVSAFYSQSENSDLGWVVKEPQATVRHLIVQLRSMRVYQKLGSQAFQEQFQLAQSVSQELQSPALLATILADLETAQKESQTKNAEKLSQGREDKQSEYFRGRVRKAYVHMGIYDIALLLQNDKDLDLKKEMPWLSEAITQAFQGAQNKISNSQYFLLEDNADQAFNEGISAALIESGRAVFKKISGQGEISAHRLDLMGKVLALAAWEAASLADKAAWSFVNGIAERFVQDNTIPQKTTTGEVIATLSSKNVEESIVGFGKLKSNEVKVRDKEIISPNSSDESAVASAFAADGYNDTRFEGRVARTNSKQTNAWHGSPQPGDPLFCTTDIYVVEKIEKERLVPFYSDNLDDTIWVQNNLAEKLREQRFLELEPKIKEDLLDPAASRRVSGIRLGFHDVKIRLHPGDPYLSQAATRDFLLSRGPFATAR